jgi:hypothetical protein
MLNGLERLALGPVVYDPDADAFRGLLAEHGRKGMRAMLTFSAEGAVMERKELSPPIPLDSHSNPPVQMIATADGPLVLISAHFARSGAGKDTLAEARLFQVDVESGAVVELVEEVSEPDVEPGTGMTPLPSAS